MFEPVAGSYDEGPRDGSIERLTNEMVDFDVHTCQ